MQPGPNGGLGDSLTGGDLRDRQVDEVTQYHRSALYGGQGRECGQ